MARRHGDMRRWRRRHRGGPPPAVCGNSQACGTAATENRRSEAGTGTMPFQPVSKTPRCPDWSSARTTISVTRLASRLCILPKPMEIGGGPVARKSIRPRRRFPVGVEVKEPVARNVIAGAPIGQWWYDMGAVAVQTQTRGQEGRDRAVDRKRRQAQHIASCLVQGRPQQQPHAPTSRGVGHQVVNLRTGNPTRPLREQATFLEAARRERHERSPDHGQMFPLCDRLGKEERTARGKNHVGPAAGKPAALQQIMQQRPVSGIPRDVAQ